MYRMTLEQFLELANLPEDFAVEKDELCYLVERYGEKPKLIKFMGLHSGNGVIFHLYDSKKNRVFFPYVHRTDTYLLFPTTEQEQADLVFDLLQMSN